MNLTNERKTTTNSQVLEKIEHLHRELNCPICGPNKGCNARGKRRPRSDKYKDHRRGLTGEKMSA